MSDIALPFLDGGVTSSPDYDDVSNESSATLNGTSADNYSYYDYAAQIEADHVCNQLMLYIAPVIIIGGIVCNGLSFIVLQSPMFRKAPSSFLLSALALVDCGVLLTGLLRHWLRAIEAERSGAILEVRSVSGAACKLHTFLTYFLTHLSAWTLILMTAERLVCVILPLTSQRMCSRARMMAAWVVVSLCLVAANAHFFTTVDLFVYEYPDATGAMVTEHACHYTAGAEHFVLIVWPWLDLALASFMPGAIIIVTNAVIVWRIRSARMTRQREMRASRTAAKEDTKSRSLAAMLLSISVLFIVTSLPITVHLAGHTYWPRDTAAQVYGVAVSYTLTSLLYYTNNALNFFMYCLSGARFRQALWALFCWRKYDAARRSSLTQQFSLSSMRKNSGQWKTSTSQDGSTP